MLKAVRTMMIVIFNIIFYGLVVFAGVQLCQTGYAFAYGVFGGSSADLPPGRDKDFTVSEGESEFSISERLAEQELVRDKYSFYVRIKLEESGQMGIRPGTYRLNTSMTHAEIVQKLCEHT